MHYNDYYKYQDDLKDLDNFPVGRACYAEFTRQFVKNPKKYLIIYMDPSEFSKEDVELFLVGFKNIISKIIYLTPKFNRDPFKSDKKYPVVIVKADKYSLGFYKLFYYVIRHLTEAHILIHSAKKAIELKKRLPKEHIVNLLAISILTENKKELLKKFGYEACHPWIYQGPTSKFRKKSYKSLLKINSTFSNGYFNIHYKALPSIDDIEELTKFYKKEIK